MFFNQKQAFMQTFIGFLQNWVLFRESGSVFLKFMFFICGTLLYRLRQAFKNKPNIHEKEG